jgi:hypothetical protein
VSEAPLVAGSRNSKVAALAAAGTGIIQVPVLPKITNIGVQVPICNYKYLLISQFTFLLLLINIVG